MPGKDRVLPYGGSVTSGMDPILLCGGDGTSACSGAYGMPVWSIMHCLWDYAGGQLEADLAADVNRHRMSVWSMRHCKNFLDHVNDWYFTLRGVRYAVTMGSQ